MVKMPRITEVREVISVAFLFLLYPKFPRERDFKKFPKNIIIRHNNTFELYIIDPISKDFHDLILAFPPAMCPLSVRAIKKFKRHPRLSLPRTSGLLTNTVGKNPEMSRPVLTHIPLSSQ